MTDSIVHEIQQNALDNNYPITGLLRKSYAVATKLNLTELREWTNCELNGYGDKEVPEYRILKGQLKCFNPYRGWMPAQITDAAMEDMISNCSNKQAISEIERLLSDGGTLVSHIPGTQQQLLQGLFSFDGEFTLFLNQANMQGIIDTVRNRILEYALQLEADGILGDGITFSQKEKEKAQVVNQTYNIHGPVQGIAGNVSDSTVTQNLDMTITEGDFNQLAEELSKHGVKFSDITELKQAIDTDGEIDAKQGLGEKVSGWIAKMVGKAADGSWNVGIATAGNILGAAINGYYGIGS